MSVAHFRLVADAILKGIVVPFLGAGVNLCNRTPGMVWSSKSTAHLPSGGELAEALAREVLLSDSDFCTNPDCPRRVPDLTRVSQNVVSFLEEGRLYDELHSIFAKPAPPTAAHRFVASLTPGSGAVWASGAYPLIVTTNYDDLMETAFKDLSIEIDVVFYDPDGALGGRFCHKSPNGTIRVIEDGTRNLEVKNLV